MMMQRKHNSVSGECPDVEHSDDNGRAVRATGCRQGFYIINLPK